MWLQRRNKPLRPPHPPPSAAMIPTGDDAPSNLTNGDDGSADVAVRAAMKGIDATTGASLTDAEISVIPLIRDMDTGQMIPLSEYDQLLPTNANPLHQLLHERADHHGNSDDSEIGSVSTVSSDGTNATGSRSRKETQKKPPRPPPPSSSSKGKKQVKGVKQLFGDLTEKLKPRGTESSSGSAELTAENKTPGHNNNSANVAGIPPASIAATPHQQHPQQQLHPQQQQVRSQNILGMPRPSKGFEVRVEPKHKSSHLHFPNLFEIQTLGNVGNKDGNGGGGCGVGNGGPIWAMKFSHCGRLLATGGQDNILRIWVLRESYPYFDEMKQKFSADNRQSPSPSHDSLASLTEEMKQLEMGLGVEASSLGGLDLVEDGEECVFMPKPFAEYSGHKADLLDISWSKNFFLLSASMDKTVRLWHVSRIECLCIFQHVDFVTAIAFHPKDDRYFLSGSLDGKLRLWNIPDKKVALWNEVEGQRKLITAANFCDSGKLCVVGTYDGRCVFYTDQLKYHTVIHVKSTRGKNQGKKITGITSMPGDDKKVLVTSNDSRVRLYDLNDASLACKFKGATNLSSQIKASFSPSGRFVICGSEDKGVYIWKTLHEYYKLASAARRDKNDNWEAIRTHSEVVTCTVFAPYPLLLIKAAVEASEEEEDQLVCEDASEAEKKAQKTATSGSSDSKGSSLDRREEFGDAFVTADFKGNIKVFVHPRKPVTETIKRSSLMR